MLSVCVSRLARCVVRCVMLWHVMVIHHTLLTVQLQRQRVLVSLRSCPPLYSHEHHQYRHHHRHYHRSSAGDSAKPSDRPIRFLCEHDEDDDKA